MAGLKSAVSELTGSNLNKKKKKGVTSVDETILLFDGIMLL